MTQHRMHLRGPWQYEWLSESTSKVSVPLTGRVTVPVDWQEQFGMNAGKACFRRRFHKPTNLDPEEKVYIVCSQLRGRARINVNETVLGTCDGYQEMIDFEITPLLKDANELAIEIEYSIEEASQHNLLWEWVAIDIRSENDE